MSDSDLEDVENSDKEDEPKVETCQVLACEEEKKGTCTICNAVRCAHHLYQCHLCEMQFCMTHWAPQLHRRTFRNDGRVVPEELPADVWSKAETAEDLVLEGVVHQREDQLVTALRIMFLLPPSGEMIAKTGLGMLLADSSIWMLVSEPLMRDKARRLEEKWRRASKGQKGTTAGALPEHQWRGKSGTEVVSAIRSWKQWCGDNMAVQAEETAGLQEALAIMVIRGFNHHTELEFVLPMEVETWTTKARTKAALKKVLATAQQKLHEERCQERWNKERLADKPNDQCSALDLVEEIKKYDPDNAWEQLTQEFEFHGVRGLTGTLKPRGA